MCTARAHASAKKKQMIETPKYYMLTIFCIIYRTFGAFQSKNALILSSSLKLILLRFFSCSFASHYLATCLNAILCVKLPL